MELLAKFKDAASMFWEALDTQEKFILAYLGSSLLVSLFARASQARDERLIARVREEIEHGG